MSVWIVAGGEEEEGGQGSRWGADVQGCAICAITSRRAPALWGQARLRQRQPTIQLASRRARAQAHARCGAQCCSGSRPKIKKIKNKKNQTRRRKEEREAHECYRTGSVAPYRTSHLLAHSTDSPVLLQKAVDVGEPEDCCAGMCLTVSCTKRSHNLVKVKISLVSV